MKKNGLTVSTYVLLNPPKIVSHVYLNGSSVLTFWSDNWKEYLRLTTLNRFDRVSIRTS